MLEIKIETTIATAYVACRVIWCHKKLDLGFGVGPGLGLGLGSGNPGSCSRPQQQLYKEARERCYDNKRPPTFGVFKLIC